MKLLLDVCTDWHYRFILSFFIKYNEVKSQMLSCV